MGSIVDIADDAVWWAIHRWKVVLPVIAGAAVVVVLVVVLAGGGDDDAPSIPTGAVATVGDTPIRQADLDHWQGVFSKTSGQTKVTAAQARKGAFSMLAQSGWITAEASKLGVTVPESDVDKSEQQLLSSYKGTKQQVLSGLGVSESDLRMTQRTALLTSKLQKKVTDALPKVSSGDIAAAYKQEPALWAHPTARDARLLIVGSKDQADKAVQALKSGTNFSQVAKSYSTNAQLAQTGGVVKGVKPGSTGEPELEHVFFTAPTGALQGPIKTSTGYAVFQVQRIVRSPDQSLAAATKAITSDIQATRQAQAVKDYVADVQKRWKAKTTCSAAVEDTAVCGQQA